MDDGLNFWQGCAQRPLGRSGDRRGDEHTRLSLLARHAEGSNGSADLRSDTKPVGAHSPVRDDAGGRAKRSAGQDRNDADALHGGRLRAGDDGDGMQRQAGEGPRVPPVTEIDGAQLPDVSDGYRGQAVEAVANFTAERFRQEPGVLDGDAAGELEELVDLSLDNLKQILEAPIDFEDWRFVNQKITASLGVISAQSKVDETRLKRRNVDTLSKIIEIMRGEEKRLPVVIEG